MKENILIEKSEDTRIDVYLAGIYKEVSRSQISRKIKKGKIVVNGKKAKPSYILEAGDHIYIDSLEREKVIPQPEKIPIDIVYEDEYIIIVNKPKGMVVHPGVGNESGSLVNALLYHTDRLSTIGGDHRPGIVHRLDKDTAGLLVVAKDDDSHKFLSKQLVERSMKREYLLLVEGLVKDNTGIIDQPIGRDPNNRLKMKVIEKNSKDAKTYFQVLERFESYTYLKASLYTGRMHQIRVHMSYMGFPIVGDRVYGKKDMELGLENQALYSYKIGFIHPHTKKYVEYTNREVRELSYILKKLRKEI